MHWDPRYRPGVIFGAGLAMLIGFPLTRWWWETHGNHPLERLEHERAAERDAIRAAAQRDFGCTDVDVSQVMFASGCGRRERYVPDGDGGYMIAGPEVPACVPQWSRDDAGADTTARTVAAQIHARGNVAVVGFPLDAFGIMGFAKLRYNEIVEARVEPSTGTAADTVTVPCLDPTVEGGVKGADCKLPWTAAVAVAECRQL